MRESQPPSDNNKIQKKIKRTPPKEKLREEDKVHFHSCIHLGRAFAFRCCLKLVAHHRCNLKFLSHFPVH